jgi:hypothetical protein
LNIAIDQPSWRARNHREGHQEVLTLENLESRLVFSAFSPDGNVLGSLSMEGFLHLWRAPSWEETAVAETKEKTEIKQP